MGIYNKFKNTLSNVYNDYKARIEEQKEHKYHQFDRWVRRKAYRYGLIGNPYEGTVYDIKESENSANGLPDYEGYGIRKQEPDNAPAVDDYKSALDVASMDNSDTPHPLQNTTPPDTSAGAYLKWGAGGAFTGAAAAAAYTNFLDRKFEMLRTPRERTSRLIRNIVIGAGAGTAGSLFTKYMLGK
jgi:hypothetical protein